MMQGKQFVSDIIFNKIYSIKILLMVRVLIGIANITAAMLI
jgi:hypothetical protein